MRPVFADQAAELHQRLHFLRGAIVIFVGQPVERTAIRPVADGEHVRAERENALHVLELVAERLHGFERAVAIRVADQQQRPAFLRGEDVAFALNAMAISEPACSSVTIRSMTNSGSIMNREPSFEITTSSPHGSTPPSGP